jgi:ketosteroid isomerase-like protein
MRNHSSVPVLTFALVALTACAQEPATQTVDTFPDQDVQAILGLDRAYQDAVKAGDWDAIGKFYAKDAVLMPPEEDTVRGADAIVSWYKDANQGMTVVDYKTDSDAVDGDRSIGYHRGTYRLTMSSSNGQYNEQGKFLWVLRRTGTGDWQIVANVWNTTPTDDQ